MHKIKKQTEKKSLMIAWYVIGGFAFDISAILPCLKTPKAVDVLCLLEMQNFSNTSSQKAPHANFCELWRPPFRLEGFSLALKSIDCNPFLGYGRMQVIDCGPFNNGPMKATHLGPLFSDGPMQFRYHGFQIWPCHIIIVTSILMPT